MTRELKITYGDDQLESPCSVNVQIISRGRLDIPRSAFDGEQPLQLDVGASIVEVLNVTTSPNRPIPPIKIDDSRLFVGPSLIGRREKIVISLLVDGDPHLNPLSQSLENVDIRQGDPSEAWQRRMLTSSVAVGALSLIMGLLITILTALFFSH